MDHTKHSQQEASCPVVDGQQNKRNGVTGELLPHNAFLEHFLPCLLLIRYGFQFCVLWCVCLSVCVFIVLCSLCLLCFILTCLSVCLFSKERGKDRRFGIGGRGGSGRKYSRGNYDQNILHENYFQEINLKQVIYWTLKEFNVKENRNFLASISSQILYISLYVYIDIIYVIFWTL